MSIPENRHTPFDELVTAQRTSRINFKPTWGVSDFRDTTTTGTGSTITETNGEFKLSTGTNTAGSATIETKQRGQYQAGTTGEWGIGIRIPVLPTGAAYAEWGYFDDNNGFGFGIDATSMYVFRVTGGTKTKTYQANWNGDKLDGTGESGLTVDVTNGYIYQGEFTWYGYGDIDFYVHMLDEVKQEHRLIRTHWITVDNAASIVDPNQPLRIAASNGGSNTTNFDVYVGGRQFSFIDGNSVPQERDTPAIRENVTVSSATYVPILGIRKKANLNGRTNSTNCRVDSIVVGANNDVYWILASGSSVDGSWVNIPNVDAATTGIEYNISATTGTIGRVIEQGFVYASNAVKSVIPTQAQIYMGNNEEMVLWAKRKSTNAAVDSVITVKEEW